MANLIPSNHSDAMLPVDTTTQEPELQLELPAYLMEDYQEYFEVTKLVIMSLNSEESQRTYRSDVKVFWRWMIEQRTSPRLLTHEDMIYYHAALNRHYSNASAQRLWTVTKRVLTKYVTLHKLPENPAGDLKGFQTEDETTHAVLTLEEARALVDQADTTTLIGLRDRAMLLILIRCGLRRAECAKLQLGDLQRDQGYYVLEVLGKGNKRARVKLPIDVYEAVAMYLEACGRKPFPLQEAKKREPLFVAFERGDHPTTKAISNKVVYRVVQKYAKQMLEETEEFPDHFSTHGARATAITLWLEGGASLQQAQYAARHRDPRTTERYQKRKFNLKDNAVDKIRW